LRQDGGDGCGERGLAVVDVANRAYVDVGLGTREFFFTHFDRSEI
jgi:hypothetical protein